MADIASFLDRIPDETAQSFLVKINELGIPIDDPRIEDFLKSIDLIDALYAGRAEETRLAIESSLAKSTFKPLSATDIAKILELAISSHSLSIDYLRIAQIVNDVVATQPISSPQVSSVGFGSKTILAAMVSMGIIVGASVSSFFATSFWLPKQVESARLQSSEDLKYLGSKEGQTFRSIVKLNSDYLDSGACQQDAARNGYFLTKGKQKITNVCLVRMP
jgi:hypothetical protein